MSERQFPCEQCGANLKYAPGQEVLHCEYCGHDTPLEVDESASVVEQDFHQALRDLAGTATENKTCSVNCGGCGAQVEFDEKTAADECPFCGATLVADMEERMVIRPESLLPFKVSRDQAQASFLCWINGLWFAPGDLKKRAKADSKLNGIFLPHWTYDCDTTTVYRGSRGDHYYETEHYTTTDSQGKTVHRTRQVRKTRWRSASGTVFNTFDDVLINASHSLPQKYVQKLEPWDLRNLVAYDDQYVSGFRAEIYQVGLEEGFGHAQQTMDPRIRQTVRRDIGGDEQRINHMQVAYRDITFKHLLLPVWLSTYPYNGKPFRFMINARTGEVQGERPWSVLKIVLLVLGILALVGLFVLVAALKSTH